MGYDEHMKLTVHNLGRIKDAELDIKPLTVFSGHNGTNKTWLAWTLFELLRLVSTGINAPAEFPSPYSGELKSKVHEKIKPLFKSLKKGEPTTSVKIDIKKLEPWTENEALLISQQSHLASLLGRKAKYPKTLGFRYPSTPKSCNPSSNPLSSNWRPNMTRSI